MYLITTTRGWNRRAPSRSSSRCRRRRSPARPAPPGRRRARAAPRACRARPRRARSARAGGGETALERGVRRRLGLQVDARPAEHLRQEDRRALAAVLDAELHERAVADADPVQDLRQHAVLAVLGEHAQLVRGQLRRPNGPTRGSGRPARRARGRCRASGRPVQRPLGAALSARRAAARRRFTRGRAAITRALYDTAASRASAARRLTIQPIRQLAGRTRARPVRARRHRDAAQQVVDALDRHLAPVDGRLPAREVDVGEDERATGAAPRRRAAPARARSARSAPCPRRRPPRRGDARDRRSMTAAVRGSKPGR